MTKNFTKLVPRIILITNLVFLVFLRLPSLFEPAWYGDEGIYATIAQQLNKDQLLYRDIWDHKPPGLYMIYTLSDLFPNVSTGNLINNIFVYKLINILTGVISIILVFKLSKLLFPQVKNNKHNIIIFVITLLSTIGIGSTIWEGNIFNAENVFIPISLFAIYYYLSNDPKTQITLKTTFIVGLIFGFALFIKIHPLFSALTILWLICLKITKGIPQINLRLIKKLVIFFLVFLLGLLLPMIISYGYYLIMGAGKDFIFAVWSYNFKYSSDYEPAGMGFVLLRDTIIRRLLFVSFTILVMTYLWFKEKITYRTLFIFSWAVMTFFAVKLSSRVYLHYFLQLVVPLSLLIGLAISQIIYEKNKYQMLLKASHIILFIYLLLNLGFDGKALKPGYIKPKKYYTNGYSYMFNPSHKEEWYKVFNNNATDYKMLSELLEEYKNEKIFVWGSKPWLYYLLEADTVSKYIVHFHVSDPKQLAKEINNNDTQLIVIDQTRESSKTEAFIAEIEKIYTKKEVNLRYSIYIK